MILCKFIHVWKTIKFAIHLRILDYVVVIPCIVCMLWSVFDVNHTSLSNISPQFDSPEITNSKVIFKTEQSW